MSGQNRFLLPPSLANKQSKDQLINQQQINSQSSSCSVDADFDSYWDEEARNPLRNRIRIGRQYQATVPPLLRPGEKDRRKLDDLETLRFCPNKSADLTSAELDHYFNVAKSINLFASLVETRCLLGKDVTIADLNHIKNKEGLSLASVIQPTPLISLKASMSSQFNGQSTNNNPSSSSNNNSQNQSSNNSSSTSPKSLNLQDNSLATANQSSATSQRNNNNNKNNSTTSELNNAANNSSVYVNLSVNPFIKALSHFISLHHPGHQETGCKKNQIETSLANDDSTNNTSLGTLRPPTTASSNVSLPKETKVSRSRASKQASLSREALEAKNTEDLSSNNSNQDWTREEIELFAKALEICGKNFGAIKKEFLPSKSVRSIVEYYYIGTREYLDSKRKTQQSIVETDACSSPEKQQTHKGQGGGGGDGDGSTGSGGSGGGSTSGNSTTANNSSGNSNGLTNSNSNNSSTNNRTNNSADDQRNKTKSASDIKIETQESEKNHKQHNSMIVAKSLIPTNNSKTENRTSKTPSTQEDSRMSVYTFEDSKEDDLAIISAKQSLRSSKSSPGAEVRPLKAKPILPNNSLDADPNLSNVGSLKFYMDGQLVLKLNACQDQMKGIEKCHWVQSEDQGCNPNKVMRSNRKRSRKHDSQNNHFRQDESNMSSTDQQNSNSGMSYLDEDSKNDTSGDENSKTSADSIDSQKHPNPSSNQLYPSKKPKIRLDSLQSMPLDYQNQSINLPAQQSPILAGNLNHQQWSSQGLAAAAALFISQNAAAMAAQHQQSIKNENYDDPSNFLRSQADLMLLNRYSTSQMPSLSPNEYANYERVMRNARAVVNGNSQVNNNHAIRSSPSSMSSSSTVENIGGCNRTDSIVFPPLNLQQPPRAHSTSSSTSTSSSSASTLPMMNVLPSTGFGLSVTPSLSPATPDTITAYSTAAITRIDTSPVNLSVDTDCDTDMSVDLSMTPKKKSHSKKTRGLVKTSTVATNGKSINTPRYDFHV